MSGSMGADQAVIILTQLLENSSAKINLTNAQLIIFERCWEGESYRDIADGLQYDYDYVKQIGAQLWRSLTHLMGEPVSKSNFRTVLLRHQSSVVSKPGLTAPHCHWGEAIDTTVFFDRATELSTLQNWIEADRCRLITILGMGGMGKTALSVKLAEQVMGVKRWGEKAAEQVSERSTSPFQFLFWKSLRDAPPLADLLTELLKFLPQTAPVPDSTGAKLSLLITCLQQHRCLIVLDNFDALLAAGEQSGSYREDLADYGELLQRLGEIPHQSCVVLTSREKPQEIVALAGEAFTVRVLSLQGISSTAGQALLAAKGLNGAMADLNAVIDRYRGNPLALKIAASSIQDGFGGNLGSFLEHGIPYKNINHLLQQQINRLTELELQIMNWLAINREPVSVAELQIDLLPQKSIPELLAALKSLSRRSLIEKSGDAFTQQPVVMEYMTARLTSDISKEVLGYISQKAKVYDQKTFLQTGYSSPETTVPYLHLRQYGLAKATAKDYIRESQTRMLIEPIVQRAVAELGFDALQNRFYQILEQLRQERLSGYGVSNLIHFWRYLKIDLTGADFSGVQIRQAYLADMNLQYVNFGEVELTDCVFAETFGGILSIGFSPDGNRLAAADSAGEIRVWNLAENRLELAFRAHDHWIWAIAFSPDGRLIASASDDKTAKLWDAETGDCVRVWTEHRQSVLAVAFSPDGEWLATSSDDLTIRLRYLLDGSCDRVWLNTHDRRVWGLCFSPDGQTLASSSEDHLVKLWQVESGICVQTLIGHTNWIRAIAFHPTEPLLVSGSHDQTIHLWQTDTGTCLRRLAGHRGAVTAIGFSADGKQFVSSSHDQTLRVWETATGQCLQQMEGHTNRLWATAFSSITPMVASGGDDNSVRLWDWQQGYCNRTFQGHTNAVSPIVLSLDRKLLASCHEDETVKLWDCKTGTILQTLRGHSDRVWSATFAPSYGDDLLASGSGDQTVKLWNWRTGACLQTLSGHESWVWSVVFHPSQPILASSSYDATVKIWDIEKGICLRTLTDHTASVVGLLVDPEGEWLASCGCDQTIRIWNWKGECSQVWQGHNSSVWQLALHPDRQQIASCSYDQTVKLWDLANGTCLQTLQGHTAPVVALAFNAAGDRLYSAGFDQTIRVWDLSSGDCLQVLQGHHGIIAGLAVEDRLISSCFDETIKFWDLQTGACLDSWRTPRPYEGLNIKGTQGISPAQIATLMALGAVEVEPAVIPMFARQRSRVVMGKG